VARIARRRHGTVDVDEREGGGAVFTVTLPPLVPAPAAAGPDGGVPR